MSFRYRKSVALGKGLRLNVSKTGIGGSVGIPGLRYSAHSSGRTTRTAGIPGTGMYFRTDSVVRSRKAFTAGQRKAAPLPSSPALLKTSRFAPKYEKEFIKGVKLAVSERYREALPHFRAARESSGGKAVSPAFWQAYCELQREGHQARATERFAEVVAADMSVPDPLMSKYGIQAEVRVNVTPRLVATVPFSTLGAALILAELYQEAGEPGKAAGVLEGLLEAGLNDLSIKASLAELYTVLEDWPDVIDLTDGVENADDVGCQTLIFRAKALGAKNLHDAALEALRQALRSKKRSGDLLKEARYQRALTYEALGKHGMARKDFERLYAEDSSFADVASRLSG